MWRQTRLRTVCMCAFTALLTSLAALPAQAQSLHFDDFESGTAGWTIDMPSGGVGWAADNSPFGIPGGATHSPANSLNYNDGTDYDNGTGNNGSAESPEVNISVGASPTLFFWCNYDTETEDPGQENNYDIRTVQILSGGAPVYSLQLLHPAGPSPGGNTQVCDASGTWHEHSIPLDPLWGTITVRFRFDSVDGQFNGHAGWFIDDFNVSATSTGGGGGPVDPGFGGESDPFGLDAPERGEGANGDRGANDSLCAAGTARPGRWPAILPGLLFLLLLAGVRRRAYHRPA